jgi:glucose/arabinose dehydrogenase/PKD repeat protein
MKGLLVAAVSALSLVSVTATARAVTLPSGFSDELVTSLGSPMAIAFTPDGRMLLPTKTGALRVRTAAGALLATPALDLSARLCTNFERGLLGVAVDPAFADNHFVYLYYTLNKFNNACPSAAASTPVNRVARFTLPAGNVIDPASELVLVDNIPSYKGDHNAGDLNFGKDGNLYVSIGDGGCDYAGNSGCAGANDASRDQHVLLGKILRITRSGGIPADNPFTGAGTARCNATGQTTPGNRCQETFAWGLRNPFRFAFDPDAGATRMYINDVGQNLWEEIDEGAPGADYGWNVREGHCANASTTDCGPPPLGMTNPIFDYGHADGCASITGGAFVPAGLWPPAYDGTYLFGDYVCGRIFRLVPKAGGGFDRVTFADGLGSSSAVHLVFGPSGTGRALYYTTFAGGGAVRRIVYSNANRPPTAAISAAPSAGGAPLTVGFSGSQSSDPDAGDTLTYLWDFGDAGAPVETSAATTSHTYTIVGTYTATLRVRDNHGSVSAPVTQRIDVGNTPPAPAIESPVAAAGFAVGETLLLRGSAGDAQDGALPATALSWTVLRHHGTHTHPLLGPVGGNDVSLTAPPPEDLSATTNSYIEVQLTATDSKGATTTVARDILPRLANLSLATQPSGLTLSLDGTPFIAPRTWTSWEGWAVTVAAPDQAGYGFGSWSDGGARSHAIVTPPGGASLTATFEAPAAIVAGVPVPPPVIAGSSGAPLPPPLPAPRACTQPRSTLVTRARAISVTRAGATVIARTGRRPGARARRSYRVQLLRRCSIVATGSVRDRRLVLRVRSTGTRTVTTNGTRRTVKRYPRLSGSYLLTPAGDGPRIAVTTVRF